MQTFAVCSFTRPGIEPKSTVSVKALDRLNHSPVKLATHDQAEITRFALLKLAMMGVNKMPTRVAVRLCLCFTK